MKFGLALPYNETRNMPRFSKLAEEAGWDGVFVGDAIWTEDPMIGLAAAAVVTSRIRLGTLINPVPLRRPWKLASESLALDLLSNGRLILGLGAGAVWMGWQGFPDVVTETKARAEMLDETIAILTQMYRGKPFVFDGNHYHIKLTLVDEIYYPPKPLQQPRIPIWVPAIWPRKQSMQRILKCDGVIPEKVGPDGRPEAVTPEDVRQINSFVDQNRKLSSPFDIAILGKALELEDSEQAEKIRAYLEAGASWWIEDCFAESGESLTDLIRRGPPGAGE
jgi:hypothetical protein